MIYYFINKIHKKLILIFLLIKYASLIAKISNLLEKVERLYIKTLKQKQVLFIENLPKKEKK